MKKKTDRKENNPEPASVRRQPTAPSHPGGLTIVALGASAGGLGALNEFFSHMTHDSGLVFVVVQHMDPDHKSMLAGLLQKVTRMPVQMARQGQQLAPNQVYINPPHKSMEVKNGKVHLSEPVKRRGLRLPIDHLMLSLAREYAPQSIGIIFSGMGSDGSLGLRAIKEQGGLALVQEPSTARFDSMPVNAMQETEPDGVAPPGELAHKLAELITRPRHLPRIDHDSHDPHHLEEIIALLNQHSGSDFSSYKKTTLYRRLERRMSIHQCDGLACYLKVLKSTPAEVGILFRELLIGVTSFFRDPAGWEYLREKALPELVASRPARFTLRAWVPACSTGEEAYSLAIILHEVQQSMPESQRFNIQIFATDLDDTAIEKARQGLFAASALEGILPGRLEKYFIPVKGKFQVAAAIREKVVFAHQDVLKDPPFTRLDVVSCRNLLIYIRPEHQRKLIGMFHYCLNPGGVLQLGSSETPGSHDHSFLPLDTKLKIYKKAGTPQDHNRVFPTSFSRKAGLAAAVFEQEASDNLQALTHELLLKNYTPASVLATPKGDILNITGSTGHFLEPPAGKANFNLFAMAREGLREELPMAFNRAHQSFEEIVLKDIPMGAAHEKPLLADVIVRQLQEPLPLKGKMLVVFRQLREAGESPPGPGQDDPHGLEVSALKEELKRTRMAMQRVSNEYSMTNEELQSGNEELASSKEEMQSLNEGLQAVNEELELKVEEVVAANNDLYNLLNSIEIAVLFLDGKLNIRQFTPAATDIFRLMESDIGRLFTDQSTHLIYPEMFEDTRQVLRTLKNIQKEVFTNDNRWFRVRIMPYRTLDHKVDGLVVTFIDITYAKLQEASLREYQALLQKFINQAQALVVGLSDQGTIIEFNVRAEEVLGYQREQVMGRDYLEVFVPEDEQQAIQQDLRELLSDAGPKKSRHLVKTAAGEKLMIEWTAHKVYDENGKYSRIINIGTNIFKP